MLRKLIASFILIQLYLLSSSNLCLASDTQLLKKKSSWNWPENQRILQQVDGFLTEHLSGSQLAQAKQMAIDTSASRGVSMLDYILSTTAKVEPGIDALKQLMDAPFASDTSTKIEAQISSILANGSIPIWLKTDLQLISCRYLVHHDLFDEALQRLQPLAQETTSDPATWFFCMAICQHHLMQRTQCLETLDKLLERETELPTRYAITARLMQADIKPLKEDSLDEIARMMNDVERRLALGRTGKTVRDREQAIVDKLEKMIDQLEQQQQEQEQQQQKKNQSKSQSQNGQQQNQKPMENSQKAGAKGNGEVDQKDIGDGSGWGNLPPAQRQEALQNMTKDLPSHYREVIEAYFKKLATNKP